MVSPEEPGTLPDAIWRRGARKTIIEIDVKYNHKSE